MDEETVQDIWFISTKSVESDIEDEMDRADYLLDLGIQGEWVEWGDEDNLDI